MVSFKIFSRTTGLMPRNLFHGPTQNGEDGTFKGNNNELLAHLEILTIAFLIPCHCSLTVTQKWVMFIYKGQNEKQSDFPNP